MRNEKEPEIDLLIGFGGKVDSQGSRPCGSRPLLLLSNATVKFPKASSPAYRRIYLSVNIPFSFSFGLNY